MGQSQSFVKSGAGIDISPVLWSLNKTKVVNHDV